jgi:hypothetical protein
MKANYIKLNDIEQLRQRRGQCKLSIEGFVKALPGKLG